MNVLEIGTIIKKRRKELGLTQKYLAVLANTGIRYISDLENGKETTQLGKLLDVLNVLEIEMELSYE